MPLWFAVDGDAPRDCWFDPAFGVLSRFVELAFFVFDLSSVLPLPRVAMTRSPSKPFGCDRAARRVRSVGEFTVWSWQLAASEMPVCGAAIVPLSGLEYIGDFTSRASFPARRFDRADASVRLQAENRRERYRHWNARATRIYALTIVALPELVT